LDGVDERSDQLCRGPRRRVEVRRTPNSLVPARNYLLGRLLETAPERPSANSASHVIDLIAPDPNFRRPVMTIEVNVLPYKRAGIAKQVWIAPCVHILTINAAEGAQTGPKCDKHGSLSATSGNDKCLPDQK
jgi:hypothetical protein